MSTFDVVSLELTSVSFRFRVFDDKIGFDDGKCFGENVLSTFDVVSFTLTSVSVSFRFRVFVDSETRPASSPQEFVASDCVSESEKIGF